MGDTIRVELVFRHPANITEVRAGFFTDRGGSDPIVLEDYDPDVLRRGEAHNEYRAVVEALVLREHVKDSYHCGFVKATTAEGREAQLPGREALPEIRFEVREEPRESLNLSSSRFV